MGYYLGVGQEYIHDAFENTSPSSYHFEKIGPFLIRMELGAEFHEGLWELDKVHLLYVDKINLNNNKLRIPLNFAINKVNPFAFSDLPDIKSVVYGHCFQEHLPAGTTHMSLKNIDGVQYFIPNESNTTGYSRTMIHSELILGLKLYQEPINIMKCNHEIEIDYAFCNGTYFVIATKNGKSHPLHYGKNNNYVSSNGTTQNLKGVLPNNVDDILSLLELYENFDNSDLRNLDYTFTTDMVMDSLSLKPSQRVMAEFLCDNENIINKTKEEKQKHLKMVKEWERISSIAKTIENKLSKELQAIVHQ